MPFLGLTGFLRAGGRERERHKRVKEWEITGSMSEKISFKFVVHHEILWELWSGIWRTFFFFKLTCEFCSKCSWVLVKNIRSFSVCIRLVKLFMFTHGLTSNFTLSLKTKPIVKKCHCKNFIVNLSIPNFGWIFTKLKQYRLQYICFNGHFTLKFIELRCIWEVFHFSRQPFLLRPTNQSNQYVSTRSEPLVSIFCWRWRENKYTGPW